MKSQYRGAPNTNVLALNTLYLDYEQLLNGNTVVDNKIFNQVWAMYHFQTEKPAWMQ